MFSWMGTLGKRTWSVLLAMAMFVVFTAPAVFGAEETGTPAQGAGAAVQDTESAALDAEESVPDGAEHASPLPRMRASSW